MGDKGDKGDPGDPGTMGEMGTPGAGGQACWDLDGNAACDPATEDTNNDETCDVGDCIGPEGPAGPAGTAGQLGVGVFGTASVTITSTSGATPIPGLTTTVTVPAASAVMISTDGGLGTTDTTETGFSVVDIVITADGALLPNGGYHRVIAANTTGLTGMIANWSMSTVTTLSAGAHTIQVQAIGGGMGSDATVSGNNTSVFQGSLGVVVLKL